MNYKLGSKSLRIDKPFSHNSINYPANWLRLSSQADRDALGITKVAVTEYVWFDKRFYKDKDTARPLADCKAEQCANQKPLARELLTETDWLAVRKAEAGTAIPSATATYRAAIRTKSNEREAQINACSDVAALATLIDKAEGASGGLVAWPTKPS